MGDSAGRRLRLGHRPGRDEGNSAIQLANGPGMTMFGPDGRYAFVCSSFTPELDVVDVASHEILKRLPQDRPSVPTSL